MSELNDWLNHELYPALFERMPEAMPEHTFKRHGRDWYSATYLDGRPHDRTDKTKVSHRAPYCIREEGGDVKEIITYVMERDGLTFIEAAKRLAAIAGVPPPSASTDGWQHHAKRSEVLEDAASYLRYCLHKSATAEPLRQYLNSRGYTSELIEAMELGYLPSIKQLSSHLLGRGHTAEEVEEALALARAPKGIGSTHQLAIPYRAGRLRGFKFRTIGQELPKYLNSKGLDKSAAFFNIGSRASELLIVEGELDALACTARGLDNAVAIGGDRLSKEQAQDAVRRGVRAVRLCFDREAGKEDETADRITAAAEVLRDAGVKKIYVVVLPDIGHDKVDADSLIAERGIEAMRDAIHKAQTYGAYAAERLLTDLIQKARNGEITYRQRDLIVERIVAERSYLSGQDRADYNHEVLKLDIGIDRDVLDVLEEDYLTARAEAEAADKMRRLLREVQTIGNHNEALDKLSAGIADVQASSGRSLVQPALSYSDIEQQIANMPPALPTGYRDLDRFVAIKPAAITLIAGRPRHGKTTFMLNVLYNLALHQPDKTHLFFTYEEPLRNIAAKLLNLITDTDLSRHYLGHLSNYDFIKYYIATGRSNIPELEAGRAKLRTLIDSGAIQLIDRSYSAEQLAKLLAYLAKRERIGAVVIDYVQRMWTERRTQDKRTEVGHISDVVLRAAKDTGLPVVLGSQLNRAAVERPALENLKEAGNLEEDANTVLSVYNDSVDQQEVDYIAPRLANLDIRALKNREGESDLSATLHFDRWTGRMKNM